MEKIRSVFRTIGNYVMLFPEIFALPIAWLCFVFLKEILYACGDPVAIVIDDWIQFPVMAAIILMFGNFVAHGAIKFNQPDVWKEYQKCIEMGGETPKKYYLYLCLYLLCFSLILLAVIGPMRAA